MNKGYSSPTVINFERRTKEDFNLKIEHRIFQSCSAQLNNQWWYFGGVYDQTKVSKLSNCKLEEQKNLKMPERVKIEFTFFFLNI